MRLFLALSENKEIYHTPKHKIRRINSKNKQIIKISWENKTTKTPNTLTVKWALAILTSDFFPKAREWAKYS